MEGKEPRLTQASLKVLRALMTEPTGRLSGAQIHMQTSVMTGTLYPILLRLEDAGWVASEWEDMPKPRRRLYHLTLLGQQRAKTALDSVS